MPPSAVFSTRGDSTRKLSRSLSRLWLSAGLASYGQSSPPSPPSLASQGWRPPSLASQRLVAVSGSPPHHTYLPPRTCRYGTVQSLFIKERIDAAFPSMNKRLLTRSDGRSRPVVTPPPHSANAPRPIHIPPHPSTCASRVASDLAVSSRQLYPEMLDLLLRLNIRAAKGDGTVRRDEAHFSLPSTDDRSGCRFGL